MALPTLGRRFRSVANLVATVYGGYKSIQGLSRIVGAERAAPLYRRHHRRSAELAYRTAADLQGLLVKTCQFLSARADVLPDDYVRILSTLQDRVPARPFLDIALTIEEELGAPLRDMFAYVEKRPLAAASLAQVHRARLRDGREVALKVQYPEIARLVETDLGNLGFCIKWIARLEPAFDLRPILREVAHHVRQELDFEHEARNAARLRANLGHRSDVVIPEVIPRLSSPRLLVMEYAPGIKVTDVDALAAAGIDKHEVAHLLFEVFCHQILVDGVFHADPHPGNLLIQPGPRLVLLDFGLVKDFPPGFVHGIVQLALGIAGRDRAATAAAFRGLGFRTRDEGAESLIGLADAVFGEMLHSGRAYSTGNLVEFLHRELPRLLRANPLVDAPGDLLLVMRVIGLLSGIGKILDSQVDPMRVLLPLLMPVPSTLAPASA